MKARGPTVDAAQTWPNQLPSQRLDASSPNRLEIGHLLP